MTKDEATNDWVYILNESDIDPNVKYRVYRDAKGNHVQYMDRYNIPAKCYLTARTSYRLVKDDVETKTVLDDATLNLEALQLAVKVAIPGTHSSDILAAAKGFRKFLKGEDK